MPHLAHLAPEILAAPFDRLDSGDLTDVKDVDILLDLPEVITVARIHFGCGVGYEFIFSDVADYYDYRQAVQIVGNLHLIQFGPWGVSAHGDTRWRALYWDHNN